VVVAATDSSPLSAEISVFPGPEEAARAAAHLLVTAARARAAIALSGGSTPIRAYELAAEDEPDWSEADVWLADERVVPIDDSRSNARLVRETLLARLDGQPERHFVRTELGPPAAADAYDRELRGVSLALVLLGIGPDGHTASLFPNASTLDEDVRLAAAAEPGLEPFVPRVTLTLPALSAADHVVFLVTGAEKADAVARAFGESPSPATPASLVRSRQTTTALLDEASAAKLRP
jgi:6-phosphogluconolactonase